MGDEVKDLLGGVYAAINSGDLDALDGLFHDDYIDHAEGHRGVEPFKAQIGAFRSAFPDLHVEIDDILVDGDRFSSRTTVTGTHDGDLMGMPPTGTKIQITAVDMGVVRDGKAAERWGGLDMYALLVQLGVIPAPQPA